VSAVVLEQPDVNRTPRAAALSSGRNITSPLVDLLFLAYLHTTRQTVEQSVGQRARPLTLGMYTTPSPFTRRILDYLDREPLPCRLSHRNELCAGSALALASAPPPK
jgi:hypothetical protein